MTEQPGNGKRVRFGPYEADLAAGELLKDGRRVRLQEQPFQVLAALLERPNEVVTRDELRQRLWPDATFVDFDQGLNTAINKLRDALGDSAANPRFVETLPRRGYRFTFPLPDQGAVNQPSPATPANRRSFAKYAIVALVSVPVGLALALLGLRPQSSSSDARPVKLALPVDESINSSTISPDGRYIAYVTDAGVLKAWDLRLGQARAVAGPGILAGQSSTLFWSRDSEFIGFPLDQELKKVAVLGGQVTTICGLPGQFLRGDWSPDGESIVFAARSFLYEVSTQGGEPHVLVEPWSKDLPYLAGPQFLPSKEGRKLLYVAFSSGPDDAQTVIHDLTTGQREIVANGGGAAYSSSGHIVYRRFEPPGIMALPFSVETLEATGEPFLIGAGSQPISVSRNGTLVYQERTGGLQQLVWRDRTGRRLGMVGAPSRRIVSPSLSPNGNRLAAVMNAEEETNRDIWVLTRMGPRKHG